MLSRKFECLNPARHTPPVYLFSRYLNLLYTERVWFLKAFNAMTTPFIEAFRAKESGAISWDEYIRALLTRCTDAQRKSVSPEEEDELEQIDAFTHDVWMWIENMNPVDDAGPLEAVFLAYRHGNVQEVERKLAFLEAKGPPRAVEGVKTSLALISCQERRADVLKHCLDAGNFGFEASLEEEMERVDPKTDPETFQVVQQSEQFQRVLAQNERNRKNRERMEQQGIKDPSVTFDKGGKLPVNW